MKRWREDVQEQLRDSIIMPSKDTIIEVGDKIGYKYSFSILETGIYNATSFKLL
jgi:hypothetical protein